VSRFVPLLEVARTSVDTTSPNNNANGPRLREGGQIGYASYSKRERRSTLEPQRVLLGWEGCQQIRDERVEGSDHERIVLERLLDRMEEGDTLTVTKLDRLATSAREAMGIVQILEAKGAFLRILNLKFDSATPVGRHMLRMLEAVAELERSAVLDKQHEDKVSARLQASLRKEAEWLARKIDECELALAHLAEVGARFAKGTGVEEIARELSISVLIVYEALDELSYREAGDPRLEGSLARARERLAALTKSLRIGEDNKT
jgi:DNA invertase Pin-like site-specific DNA recombinase